MTFRQSLRAVGYLISEVIPSQAIRVARGRDWAVNNPADQLADAEETYEALEPGCCVFCGATVSSTIPPVDDRPAGVEFPPDPPPAGHPTRRDLTYAAGVVKAYAALGDTTPAERIDLRALADRLTQ